MKAKHKIAILIIFIINLFSCIFFHKAESGTITGLGEPNGRTFAQIQREAGNMSSDYFGFSAEAIIGANKWVSDEESRDAGFTAFRPGLICASPGVDEPANKHKVICIMDIKKDDTVDVYTRQSDGEVKVKTTTSDEAPVAVRRAQEMAFVSYRSVEMGETPGTGWSQVLHAYYVGRHFSNLSTLGVPSSMKPQYDEYNTPPGYEEGMQKEAEKKVEETETSKDIYTGRIVFFRGGGAGNKPQNQMVFSGHVEQRGEPPEILIKKEDAFNGSPLSGARYSIQYKKRLNDEWTTVRTGLTTNDNGKIKCVFSDNKYGWYRVKETNAPNNYYIKPNESTSEEFRLRATDNKKTVTFKNVELKKLKIIKKDAEDGKILTGAKFKIYALSSDGTQKWVKDTGNGYFAATATDESDAKQFDAGLIEKLVPRTYYIKEIKAPTTPHAYEINEVDTAVTLSQGNKDTFEVTILNKAAEVTIKKYIKDSDDVPIEGIKFGIKDWIPEDPKHMQNPDTQEMINNYWSDGKYWYDDGNWGNDYDNPKRDENGKIIKDIYGNVEYEQKWYPYMKHNSTYYNEHDSWLANYKEYIRTKTEWVSQSITDKNGQCKIDKFRADGHYTLYEVESNNPYFDIEGGDLKAIRTDFSAKIKEEIKVYNERTYVDIEGTVFLDKPLGKENTTNEQYDRNEGNNYLEEDEAINGVKVILKSGGNEIASTISSGQDENGKPLGHYKFYGDRDHGGIIRASDLGSY